MGSNFFHFHIKIKHIVSNSNHKMVSQVDLHPKTSIKQFLVQYHFPTIVQSDFGRTPPAPGPANLWLLQAAPGVLENPPPPTAAGGRHKKLCGSAGRFEGWKRWSKQLAAPVQCVLMLVLTGFAWIYPQVMMLVSLSYRGPSPSWWEIDLQELIESQTLGGCQLKHIGQTYNHLKKDGKNMLKTTSIIYVSLLFSLPRLARSAADPFLTTPPRKGNATGAAKIVPWHSFRWGFLDPKIQKHSLRFEGVKLPQSRMSPP